MIEAHYGREALIAPHRRSFPIKKAVVHGFDQKGVDLGPWMNLVLPVTLAPIWPRIQPSLPILTFCESYLFPFSQLEVHKQVKQLGQSADVSSRGLKCSLEGNEPDCFLIQVNSTDS